MERGWVTEDVTPHAWRQALSDELFDPTSPNSVNPLHIPHDEDDGFAATFLKPNPNKR